MGVKHAVDGRDLAPLERFIYYICGLHNLAVQDFFHQQRS